MDDGIGDGALEEYVQFYAAGAWAKGEFRCADCGYGVTVASVLPVCPMCTSASWEQSGWSPLSRALAATRMPL